MAIYVNGKKVAGNENAKVTAELIGAIPAYRVKETGNIIDIIGSTSARYLIKEQVKGMPKDDCLWYVDVSSNGTNNLSIMATLISEKSEIYHRNCINDNGKPFWGEWNAILISGMEAPLVINDQVTCNSLRVAREKNEGEENLERFVVQDGDGIFNYKSLEEMKDALSILDKTAIEAIVQNTIEEAIGGVF